MTRSNFNQIKINLYHSRAEEQAVMVLSRHFGFHLKIPHSFQISSEFGRFFVAFSTSGRPPRSSFTGHKAAPRVAMSALDPIVKKTKQ